MSSGFDSVNYISGVLYIVFSSNRIRVPVACFRFANNFLKTISCVPTENLYPSPPSSEASSGRVTTLLVRYPHRCNCTRTDVWLHQSTSTVATYENHRLVRFEHIVAIFVNSGESDVYHLGDVMDVYRSGVHATHWRPSY